MGSSKFIKKFQTSIFRLKNFAASQGLLPALSPEMRGRLFTVFPESEAGMVFVSY
jgi:hypothetical protein